MINYVRMYDINNVLISSWEDHFSGTTPGINYALYPTPANVYKIIYSLSLSGSTQVFTKYNLGPAPNQYFYFNDEYVDTIYFTGKKENLLNKETKNITNGKKVNVVEIKLTEKIRQNTGFNLSEKQLFDFGSTPYVFTVSGTTVKRYNVDDNSFEGFTTRTLSNRNTILNLTNDKVENRYTATENNFYN